MSGSLQTLSNENGKTAVIIILVLGVIAYLVYPGTSPFKSDYYDLKVEQNLKDLHSACNRFWSEGIAEALTSKITGGKKEPGDCTLKTVTSDPYNFKPLEGMTLEIESGSKVDFKASGKHAESDKTIRINASGNIES